MGPDQVRAEIELQSYQRVRAPFAGVITVRYVDGGALITSGSTSSSTPMFRLAQSSILRVFVNVPQTFMNAITSGLAVGTPCGFFAHGRPRRRTAEPGAILGAPTRWPGAREVV